MTPDCGSTQKNTHSSCAQIFIYFNCPLNCYSDFSWLCLVTYQFMHNMHSRKGNEALQSREWKVDDVNRHVVSSSLRYINRESKSNIQKIWYKHRKQSATDKYNENHVLKCSLNVIVMFIVQTFSLFRLFVILWKKLTLFLSIFFCLDFLWNVNFILNNIYTWYSRYSQYFLS